VIGIVVAYSANRVIGRDGELPWRLPSDLRRFRELTTGGTVLMGRRTFESLPDRFRPLPDRRNLVLSRDPAYAARGSEVHPTLTAALDACDHDCMVIGGGTVYAEALALADTVFATEVARDVAGDVTFPALDPAAWREAERSASLSENGHTFAFVTYERRG
jgi:dihydrofolate reductase